MHNTTGHRSPAHRHSGNPPDSNAVLHDKEFAQFRDMIYRIAGITMSPAKKQLVSSRLAKRLKHHNFTSYGDYFRLITSPQGKAELQVAVDSLTTNETHFFASRNISIFCAIASSLRARRGVVYASGARPVPAGKNHTALRCCWMSCSAKSHGKSG